MYVLKNSFVSISRNKGRNILIAIIVMVIAAACSITLAIRNSADKIVTAYENKYPIEVSIGMNRETLTNSFKENAGSQEEMIESFNSIESLTKEEVESYGDSVYVSSYSYTYSISVNADGITEATDSLVKETTKTEVETETKTEIYERPGSNGGNAPGKPGESNQSNGTTEKSTTTKKKTTTTTIENIRNEKASKGAFTLTGYNSFEAMSDFISGNYTITDGAVSDDFTSNTCVISEELATLNELAVGDIITLVSPYDEDITYELEITGIYKENSEASSDMSSMFTSSANTIITNVTVAEAVSLLDEEIIPTVTPTYILTDTEVVDEFEEEVIEKGLSEYFTLTNNVEEVESATKSIVNVKTFATTFLMITLIIGAVVLLVINMINIRERKYEIGVLRTIGMRKSLVITQFMFELLVVAIIGLLIGAGIGAVCSVEVANNLLKNEIENAESDYEAINENFGGNMPGRDNREIGEKNQYGIVQLDTVDSMEAIVDFKVLLQLLGIGVSLTIISSISACIAIARFSPLTILKERS